MSSGTVTVEIAGYGGEAVGVQEAGAGKGRAGQQVTRSRKKVVPVRDLQQTTGCEFAIRLTTIDPVWRSIVPLLS